jgi:hypothetical protein
VSRARIKTRYAMILLMLVCSTVHADLITNSTDAFSSRANHSSLDPYTPRHTRSESVFDSSVRNSFGKCPTPVHLLLPLEEARRKAGAMFHSDSSRWINPWTRTAPTLLLLPLDDIVRSDSNLFQRSLDELLSGLQRLVMGKQRRITYRGCRNTVDPEACAHYK